MTASTEAAGRAGPGLGRLARGGVGNLVGSLISGLASFGLVVMVTRGFPVAEVGVFFAATTVFLLGARLADLGASTGLVYFLARSRGADEEYRVRDVLRVASIPVLVASVLVAAALFVFAPQWAALAIHGDSGSFAAFLRILAVFLPVAVLYTAWLAATRGFGSIRPTILLERIGRPVAQVALTLVAIAVGSGYALTLAWAAPYLAGGIAAWLWLSVLRRRKTSGARSSPPAGPSEPGMGATFWRFTAPRAVTGVVQLALQRMDILLVAALVGPVEAAIYAAATRFTIVSQLITHAFTQVVEPKLSELLGRGAQDATRVVYQASTCWVVLLNWPLQLTLIAGAPVIVKVFGSGYESGQGVVVVLACAMLVATACGMVDTVLIMAGRTTWNLGNAVLALVVTVAADLLLIPRFGILGAALGWGIGILAKNLVPLGQIAFSLRLHPFGAGTRLAILLSVACFGIVPITVSRLTGAQPAILVAALAVGSLAYAWLCWRFRRRLHLEALLELRQGRSVPRHRAEESR